MQGLILQQASGFLNRRRIESVFVEKLYIPFHHSAYERGERNLAAERRSSKIDEYEESAFGFGSNCRTTNYKTNREES